MSKEQLFVNLHKSLEDLDKILMGDDSWKNVSNLTFSDSGIAIVAESPETVDLNTRYIIMPEFSSQLSWLFIKISEIFSPVLDSNAKTSFWIRLADAIDFSDCDSINSVFSVAHEAYHIASELESDY